MKNKVETKAREKTEAKEKFAEPLKNDKTKNKEWVAEQRKKEEARHKK